MVSRVRGSVSVTTSAACRGRQRADDLRHLVRLEVLQDLGYLDGVKLLQARGKDARLAALELEEHPYRFPYLLARFAR